jgi:hypothetical protein
MAKYTSDTELIEGAAAAYKNWDNVAGMYKGLEDLSEAGREMTRGAIEDRDAEQEKLEKEKEEAAAEKKRQDGEWYDISGKVYENAGSFMKDIEYKDVANQISSLKERYITAKESGSPEEMAAVMIEFNNLKGNVDDHKAFRETITNPEYGISNAMKHSGVEPGDNGEDHNFLTGLVGEDYKITREGGQTYYNVGGVKKTMKEIKDMTILKDNIPYAAYSKAVNDFSKAKNFDRDNTEYYVRNNVIPQETNKLRAFLADDGFGNGETFSQVLNRKGNRASIEKEIMNSVFNTNGGGIDDKEWQNFTNAIVDPKNEFWKGDEEAWKKESTRIATEQLTNGIENKWKANPDNKQLGKPLTPSERLANAKFLAGQQEKQQTKIDNQNTVYSIEKEFSDGETTIGTGSRFARKIEDSVEMVDGVEKTVKGGWALYEDDKLIKNIGLDSPDILDEITKHVTDTAGKYGTFQVGVSEKEITKDGVTTKYVYAGNGRWSPKK